MSHVESSSDVWSAEVVQREGPHRMMPHFTFVTPWWHAADITADVAELPQGARVGDLVRDEKGNAYWIGEFDTPSVPATLSVGKRAKLLLLDLRSTEAHE